MNKLSPAQDRLLTALAVRSPHSYSHLNVNVRRTANSLERLGLVQITSQCETFAVSKIQEVSAAAPPSSMRFVPVMPQSQEDVDFYLGS